MKKIDSKELKSPDKLQQELQKGFQWTTQHSKLVGLLLIGFLVVGAGLSAKSYLDEKKEAELQSKYYQAEKKLVEKKNAFQAAQAQADAPKPKKGEKAPEPAGVKASGDFDKDYGPVATELNKIIEEAPKSKAAKMAALNLSDVQAEYGKNEDALNTLKKVSAGSKDLLLGLVHTQMGTIQANMNDCQSALGTWDQVLSNAKAISMHSSVKLKQGLCYESMQDFTKAERLYTEAKAEQGDSPTAKAAEKYLRLLQTAKK